MLFTTKLTVGILDHLEGWRGIDPLTGTFTSGSEDYFAW